MLLLSDRSPGPSGSGQFTLDAILTNLVHQDFSRGRVDGDILLFGIHDGNVSRAYSTMFHI